MRRPAIIFDLSSVFTVSTVLAGAAYRVAGDFGIPWEVAFAVKVRGKSFDAIAALLGGRINMPDDELPELEATLRDTFRDRIPEHPLLLQPGVESLLQQIHTAKLPIGIVSTLPADDVDLCLQRFGKKFDTVQCGHRGCPAEASPALHRAAIDALDADPATSVAIEHDVIGIESAEAADLFVVNDPTIATRRGEGSITSYNERYLLDRLLREAGARQPV
jgi:beta-phosphoglucomutase-like phosphatase (HAD superfamily)